MERKKDHPCYVTTQRNVSIFSLIEILAQSVTAASRLAWSLAFLFSSSFQASVSRHNRLRSRLHGSGQILARFHLTFIWDPRNWTDFLAAKCASLGPKNSRSPTCTLSPSEIRLVPPVLFKRKEGPCNFLSVQKFVLTRVNVA